MGNLKRKMAGDCDARNLFHHDLYNRCEERGSPVKLMLPDTNISLHFSNVGMIDLYPSMTMVFVTYISRIRKKKKLQVCYSECK